MTLIGGSDDLSTPCGHPTMIAVRQQDFCMEAVAHLEGEIRRGQRAGLATFYNSDYHYDIFVTKEDDDFFVCLCKRVADIEAIVERHHIEYRGAIRFKIESEAEWYTFYYEKDGDFVALGRGKTVLLCTEATYPTTFTGVYWGIFSEQGEITATHFSARQIK